MIHSINKSIIYRFIRFSIVGVINTLLDLAVLNLLIYIFSVTNPIIFSVCKGISFSIAVVNSYFMNKYFTFAKKQTSRRDFYVFVLISIIGLLINIAISGISFYILGLYPEIFSIYIIATISAIIGSMFTMITNYLSYSYFIFK